MLTTSSDSFEILWQARLVGFHEYIDKVTGSGKEKRPHFEALMLARSQRPLDVMLFWSLDRRSREVVMPTLTHLGRWDGYGVGWRSFTEPHLDSTAIFQEAVIAILASLAKMERIRIGEWVLAGLESQAQGAWAAICEP
jgi:DNA invertase Pin-like site-specific DNA recombinase